MPPNLFPPIVAKAHWGTADLLAAVRDRLEISFAWIERPGATFGSAKIAEVQPCLMLIDLEQWAREKYGMLPTHEIQTIELHDDADGFTAAAELHLCLNLDGSPAPGVPGPCPFERGSGRLMGCYAVWCEEA